MSRSHYQGVARDQGGRLIPGCLVSVYLTNSVTPAKVYTQASGGVSVNSVICDNFGFFEFWCDPSDYPLTQLFRITLSFFGFAPKQYDYIAVFSTQNLPRSGEVALVAGVATVTFAVAEPDTGYHPLLSGNANENFWWSNRTMNGFQINSSNGVSNATVCWGTTR